MIKLCALIIVYVIAFYFCALATDCKYLFWIKKKKGMIMLSIIISCYFTYTINYDVLASEKKNGLE